MSTDVEVVDVGGVEVVVVPGSSGAPGSVVVVKLVDVAAAPVGVRSGDPHAAATRPNAPTTATRSMRRTRTPSG
jgi:hypothetical protein